jgi:hypothetical protein
MRFSASAKAAELRIGRDAVLISTPSPARSVPRSDAEIIRDS